MKATIESTEKIVEFNGIPVRVWEGTTESGIKIHCYITRVAINSSEKKTKEFEEELKLQKPPSAETKAIPLRMNL